MITFTITIIIMIIIIMIIISINQSINQSIKRKTIPHDNNKGHRHTHTHTHTHTQQDSKINHKRNTQNKGFRRNWVPVIHFLSYKTSAPATNSLGSTSIADCNDGCCVGGVASVLVVVVPDLHVGHSTPESTCKPICTSS